MLLEFLIPVYGESPFLEKTLKSIYTDFDNKAGVLIVLDRPTEIQQMRVIEYTKLYGNLRVILSQGAGIAFALNAGVNYSKAKYIRRIDSDDELLPDSLGKQVQFLENNPDFACVGGQMNFINENGRVIGETCYPLNNFEILKRLEYQNCIAHPAALFNRQYVLNIGGYRPAMSGAEDYDLWLRLTSRYKVSNLSFKVTNYRISDQQYSKSLGSRQLLIENLARANWKFSQLNLGYREMPVEFKNEKEIEGAIQSLERAIKKSSKTSFYRLQSSKKINIAMKISQNDSKLFNKRISQLILLIQASIMSPIMVKNFTLGFGKFRNSRYE